MAVIVKDANGNVSQLSGSGISLGVGANDVGKTLEAVGNIISRGSADAGGTAIGIATEGEIHGSIWTNAGYDPAEPGKRWKRTINLVNGNVGIGGSNDAAALAPAERLVVAGNILATGDVRLAGADCAEEFNVDRSQGVEPGDVMVIAEAEMLRHCEAAYDRRVAGVVSGAGECKPGIILGRQESQGDRLPLALNGTVYCKVDAEYAPIEIGDLLTTSSTTAHAMKARDADRTPGAILGKAMRPLHTGRGLIPILVALQ